LSQQVCATHCSAYAFFGTQYGTECWCGGSNVDYTINGEGTCDYACAGDDSLICGGYYTFTIYRASTEAPTPAPTPRPTLYPEPVGCYTDKKNERVLTNMLTSDAMTPLICAAHCSNYSYFGTQYGTE
ncbi:unnamed protein product, partial [Sphacelaria rigidula]